MATAEDVTGGGKPVLTGDGNVDMLSHESKATTFITLEKAAYDLALRHILNLTRALEKEKAWHEGAAQGFELSGHKSLATQHMDKVHEIDRILDVKID